MSTPILREVLMAGLRTVALEMRTAVTRTAYSPIVASGGDLSVGIADVDGHLVAQGKDIPVQVGALPLALDAMLVDWHGRLEPGDALIGNDPYACGSNHINDVCIIMPAFFEDELIGYVADRVHWTDIGGSSPGSFNTRVPDMFAEGLCIPTLRIARGYEPVKDLWDLVFANVRSAREREWDLRAGMAGCIAGERGLARLARRNGLDAVKDAMASAIGYTERRIRTRIGKLRDGEYSAHDWVEGDGWDERPVRIEATVRIAGSDIEVDWTGSDPQTRGGVNMTWATTLSVSAYAIKAICDPDIPPNHGMFAPLTVVAEEGTVVRPRRPAPTQSGTAETVQRSADLLMMCLAQASPDRVIAGTYASAAQTVIDGPDQFAWRRKALRRDRSTVMEQSPGGMGARQTKDGVSGIKVHTGNAQVQPVEVVEFNAPVRMIRWSRVPDSGGPGRQRGGCAVVKEWQTLDSSVMFTTILERTVVPAFGLFGGRAGSPGQVTIDPGRSTEQVLPGKHSPKEVAKGHVFSVKSAGGGGYGNVWERPVALVVADILDGYVTRVGAEADYGVVLDGSGVVDEGATADARRRLQAQAEERVMASSSDPIESDSTESAAAREAELLWDRGSWSYGDMRVGSD
jgi:N-methylhydantoinase B